MDALGRARLSLDGLSVGDAFGERFFGPPGEVLKRISRRELPDAPWTYTDDTEMALSIVCGFRRLRTGIPIDRGQSFQRIADSIPMIADSSPIDGF
jgi:hypothetical protein